MNWWRGLFGRRRVGSHRPQRPYRAPALVPGWPTLQAPIPAPTAVPQVVLGFADGSAAVLDPRSETAEALQSVAARLRSRQ